MSLAAESPLPSSSSDDFAEFLDAELQSTSSSTSLDQNGDVSGDIENDRIKRRKVDEIEDVEDLQGSVPPRAGHEESGVICASVQARICPPHPGFIRGMCITCGQQQADETGVAFGYIYNGLKLGDEEIARLRGADLKKLFRVKKLILVLDLDHTLLNSTGLTDVSSEEEYLLREIDSLNDDSSGSLYKLETMHMLTKLRPFVRTFLREANKMFEMYVYTMGERSYALEMAKLLDPEGVYFSSRVISKADCTQRHQKGLDVILGADSAVLILDDTEAVWEKHKENLIVMERYHFFASSIRQFSHNPEKGIKNKSLSQMNRDESDTDGVLSSILKILKRVHQRFFDLDHGEDISGRDVRKVLKEVRQEILKGCKLVFSRVFPTGVEAENQLVWRMAERLGAKCSTEIDSSVTHVVSTDMGTEKARWAAHQKKFLVNQGWVEAAYYLWQRLPEEHFSIPPLGKHH